jgi:electron transfer flavoprotein beta subunit
MRIVVCVKITPDPSDLQVRPDGSISLERAEWAISNFDLQAIEAGKKLAEQLGGTLTALSAGPAQVASSKLKKDLLSHGPEDLTLVIDESLRTADTATTARVLAGAVQRLGGADLVLCGEGSADLYFQQAGIQLGERLGWPTFNAVCRIEPAGEGRLLVERDLEDEVEVLEVPLPAVLMVTTDINEPRLPTMKDILQAGKKPVNEWSLSDLNLAPAGGSVEVLQVTAPRQVQRKGVLLDGPVEQAAANLVQYLSKEGIL